MAERTAILIDKDGNVLGTTDNPLYIGGIVAVGSLVELTDVAIASPASGDYIGYDAATGKYVNKPVSGTGMGDVTGPSGATAGNLPILDSSGKVLSDSGVNPASFGDVDGPASSGVRNLSGFADVSGKTLISLPVSVTEDGELSMAGKTIINVGSPLSNGDAATKYYVDQYLQGLSWKPPVISVITASPGGSADGDDHIVGTGATGVLAGHDGSIATWVTAENSWEFTIPQSGWAVYNDGTSTIWVFNGTDWINIGSSGVPDAPSDGTYYTRRNGAWVEGASGEHGSHHISTGDDAIPAAVAGGASGLMTGADKTKIDGIAAGAEVNVNADWNASSGDAQILNKPSIPEAQVNSDWNAATGVASILNKPTIPSAYTLPIASSDTIGGVKIGSNVTVASDGTISVASGGSGSGGYLVQRSIEGVVYVTALMYWPVPAACTIVAAVMSLSSNPGATGSYCKVQVMKNGTLETNSIFTSDTPMQITEATTATNGIYQASGTLDSGQISLAAGDVLHFRVNQADTGSADLLVQVKVNFT